MAAETTVPLPEESPLRAGLRSARATALPGTVLVSAAAAVVVAYYQIPAFHGLTPRPTAC